MHFFTATIGKIRKGAGRTKIGIFFRTGRYCTQHTMTQQRAQEPASASKTTRLTPRAGPRRIYLIPFNLTLNLLTFALSLLEYLRASVNRNVESRKRLGLIPIPKTHSKKKKKRKEREKKNRRKKLIVPNLLLSKQRLDSV